MSFYVYIIRDPRDLEPIYVGKGQNGRMYDHWNKMLLGKPTKNRKIYNKLTAIFRAGYMEPIYEKFIENADEKLCFWMERFLIKSIGRENLTNLTDGGEGISGWVASEETIQKMRAASTGRTASAETRKKRSAALMGRVFSAETLEKMRVSGRARIRVPVTDETRRKMSVANSGKVRTPEQCKRMSESLTGRTMTPEWCAKQSARCLGIPVHENTRLALLKANLGQKRSDETRQKMREAAIRRYARAREETALCGNN